MAIRDLVTSFGVEATAGLLNAVVSDYQEETDAAYGNRNLLSEGMIPYKA